MKTATVEKEWGPLAGARLTISRSPVQITCSQLVEATFGLLFHFRTLSLIQPTENN
jgi:hypothetical protein